MTKEEAREHAKKVFESLKDEIENDEKTYKNLGDNFDESDDSLTDSENRMLGPKDDIQYQKMKKDIKESGNE